jgi:hypothetical protein
LISSPGIAHQIPPRAPAIVGDRPQHLLLELRAHARQIAQLLLDAELLELVDRSRRVVLEDERDALGPEPLNLQKFERARREFLEQLVAPLVGSPLDDLGDNHGQAFADALDLGDLAVGIAEDVDDAFGEAFDGGGAVAIAADAEAVVPIDLHEVGSLPEDARDFLILQVASESL